ncbi:alpha/beta fold hydrolase [Pseudomonas sp. N40(2020)]|uniref:alpha/beta fold hydrolase n=1 Tax=Pseudomonas sp. N40(2020) TaxID=2767798 RepID=UPI001656AE69|nr:alpha/beta fold hydrolase [Pseudomonas sp. N40(2020)]
MSQGAHTVRVDDVLLHYRVDGNGPLLFVVSPGWGVGSGYLQRGMNFLTRLFKVVFIDTRGSGQSGRPADGAKMGSNEMADDIEALRAYLGIPAISLLGHSNGGAIALSFAQHYPDRINKLMLIDSQLFGFGAGEDTQAFLARNAEDLRYASAAQLAAGVFSGQVKQPSNDEELSEFSKRLSPNIAHLAPCATIQMAGVNTLWTGRFTRSERMINTSLIGVV